MSATITADDGSGSSSPITVLSPWATSQTSRNIVHDIIGGGLLVSLVSPRPRSGVYEALFDTEEEAFACITLHEAETTFTLAEPDRPHVGMTYVIDGALDVRLDDATLDLWIVTIGYQAVIL